jgi:hypothetical protein
MAGPKDILPWIYQQGNATRNRLKQLLTDPRAFAGQLGQDAATIRDDSKADTYLAMAQRDPKFAAKVYPTEAVSDPSLMQGRALAHQNRLAEAVMGGMTVYHGSPAKFDKFDINKVNPDGGGSSFARGINLSADPSHAAAYGANMYKVDLPDSEVAKFIKWEQEVPADLAKQLPPLDMSKPIPFGGGATIEQANGQWLLKAGETSFPLREAEVKRMLGGNSGEQVYRRLVASLGGDERAASNWLKERGYKGIENNTERGARNFTVFDDQIPKIVERK